MSNVGTSNHKIDETKYGVILDVESERGELREGERVLRVRCYIFINQGESAP